MAGKKQSSKNFKNNPFKSLKGLSASGQEKGTAPEPPPPRPEEPEETEDLFARHMAMLQVDPLAGKGGQKQEGQEEKSPPTEEEDEGVFLEAMGQLNVTFRDELPEGDEEETRASARRMKQLRQGKVAVEAELDLHGHTREEALAKVAYFLEDCLYQGKAVVRIITGRGIHSEGEPVVRQAVERYLADGAPPGVLEWGRAPKRHGGEGALVVFLRRGK